MGNGRNDERKKEKEKINNMSGINGIAEILKSRKCPGIIGTRDSFGIKNEFYDPKTKTYIDTWKKWEKAGFRNPLDNPKDRRGYGSNKVMLKEMIKEKVKEQRKKNGKN